MEKKTMTSTFPMNTPASREALRWLSEKINHPFVTGILKNDTLYFRFERTDSDRLFIGLKNETTLGVLAKHEAQIRKALVDGYRRQGSIDLQEIVLECA